MPNRDIPSYPAVDMVLGAIADWVNKYRSGVSHHNEFERCGPDKVMEIAKDLGIPVSELRAIADKGPGAADLLLKLLSALHVDPDQVANANPAVMRDLQRLCVSCTVKNRCRHELAAGTAAEHFHDYCPNAYTLDALLEQRAEAMKH